MCSAKRAVDDLTARARIRDSAIVYFGRHGFQSATVRAIAADAGVSPALVIHHFGSKEALREACDQFVTDSIDELTDRASTHLQPRDLLDLMTRAPALSPLVPYMIQAVTEGGPFARKLWDRLVQDAETYLRAATAAGIVRPTADERSRAEMLSVYKLGAYMLARYVVPPNGSDTDAPADGSPPTGSPADKATGRQPPDFDIVAVAEKFTIPSLELFTYGLFTNSDYLDAFVAHQQDTRPRPDDQEKGSTA
jgi:AcrR family transcriptional regulator